MLPRHISKGIAKKAVPRSPLPSALTRCASSWGRNRWPRWTDDLADAEWKQFQRKMERFQKQIEDDPYEAIFGTSNKLLRGILRIPTEPESACQATTTSDSSTLNMSGDSFVDTAAAGKDKASSEGTRRNGTAASTAGGRASASSPWTAQQSEIAELKFDPISGRMVPQSEKTGAAQANPNRDGSVDIPIKPLHSSKDPNPVKSRDDAPNLFDDKQTKTPGTRSRDWLVQEGFAGSPSPKTTTSRPSNTNEHEQLRKVLAGYENRMKEEQQKPPAPPSDWHVQKEHSRSVPRRPELPEDDADLMTTADVRARMGIRKTPRTESAEEKERRRARLEQDFDTIQEQQPEVDDFLISLKKGQRPGRQEMKETTQDTEEGVIQTRERRGLDNTVGVDETRPRAERLETAVSRAAKHKQSQMSDDGYSHEPMGLQTSFEREKAAGRDLAADIQAKTATEYHNDGYSRKPMGLQTSFDRERASGRSLSRDIQTRTKPVQHDDGYSHEPMGLETSYEREKASGRSLADEIRAKSTPEQYDDGYSREPMGLETSYEREKASGRSLADEIQTKTNPAQYDDGYSREPMGLETSYEREKASGRSLADEIQAKTDPKQHIVEDGYSREPTGLETSYQRELASGRSLEAELKEKINYACCTHHDACSQEPIGLQSSYSRELEAVRNGERRSLADELKEKSTGAATYSDVCPPQPTESSARNSDAPFATTAPRSVEQRRKEGIAQDTVKDWYGYSLKPLGLQTSYEREVAACKNGERKSLEEELKEQSAGRVKRTSEFDDQGYSRKPTGLETSYQREVDAFAKGQRASLEQELAGSANNGVGSGSIKEETAKLRAAREQRLHDITLVREVREIYEKYYGEITTAHRQVKDAPASTEAVENEGRVDESVHRSLSAYEANNPNTYKFTPDNLEAELASQNRTSSATTSPEASPSEQASSFATSQTTAHQDGNPQPETKPAETLRSKATGAAPHIYKLLAFDRTTQAITTSHATSHIHSTGEHPIPLSVALSKLSQPAKFLPQITALQREGYEPVGSSANLLVLRLKDATVNNHNATPRRPNPVDGTTIPLPPTPTMSPTGYINLDPVMEKPKPASSHRDGKKVRKMEPVFSGGSRRGEGTGKGQSVKTVLTTLIWATAACYVAGVAGEVAKGY